MKIPTKIPAWLQVVITHLKENGSLSETAAKKLNRDIKREWPTIVEQHSDPPKPRTKKEPKQKKAAEEGEDEEEDPLGSNASKGVNPNEGLDKAIEGYRHALEGSIEQAEEDAEHAQLVEGFRERIRQLPEDLKNVLMDEYKGSVPAWGGKDDEEEDEATPAEPMDADTNKEAEADVEQLDRLLSNFKEAAHQVGATSEEHPVVAPVTGIYSIARKALHAP
jgi:hypothetical protein